MAAPQASSVSAQKKSAVCAPAPHARAGYAFSVPSGMAEKIAGTGRCTANTLTFAGCLSTDWGRIRHSHLEERGTHMAKPNPQGLPPLKRPVANAPGAPGILGELQSEVSIEAAPLLQFIARHAAAVMVVLGLFVAAVVGVGAWQWYASKRDEEAQTHFARLLLQQPGAARVNALENFAATAPDSIRLAALTELGLAALAEKDATRAAAAFARVAALDKDKPFGAIAALSQAEALMQAEKPAEALTVLETLEHSVPEQLRVQVRGLIALSARQAGKTNRAIKAYEDLLAGVLPGNDDADYYRFCIQQIKASAAQ